MKSEIKTQLPRSNLGLQLQEKKYIFPTKTWSIYYVCPFPHAIQLPREKKKK